MNTLNFLDANVWMALHSPKVWADAYLASFARVAALNLVTFDQALKSMGDFVFVL